MGKLLIGGGLAAVFAIWRGWVAERQSDTSLRQAATAEAQSNIARQGLLNDRYERGAEMLGHVNLAVRLAGIYALQRLADEHPDQYHIPIMRMFCVFVVQGSDSSALFSHTTEKDLGDHAVIFAGPDSSIPLAMDIQAAIEAIRVRSKGGISMERKKWFRLDLAAADLRGARLIDADLSMAVLTDADLGGAMMSFANLQGAWLDGANLTDADIFHANVTGAVVDIVVESSLVLLARTWSSSNISVTIRRVRRLSHETPDVYGALPKLA